jgi:hypothetical protein
MDGGADDFSILVPAARACSAFAVVLAVEIASDAPNFRAICTLSILTAPPIPGAKMLCPGLKSTNCVSTRYPVRYPVPAGKAAALSSSTCSGIPPEKLRPILSKFRQQSCRIQGLLRIRDHRPYKADSLTPRLGPLPSDHRHGGLNQKCYREG